MVGTDNEIKRAIINVLDEMRKKGMAPELYYNKLYRGTCRKIRERFGRGLSKGNFNEKLKELEGKVLKREKIGKQRVLVRLLKNPYSDFVEDIKEVYEFDLCLLKLIEDERKRKVLSNEEALNNALSIVGNTYSWFYRALIQESKHPEFEGLYYKEAGELSYGLFMHYKKMFVDNPELKELQKQIKKVSSNFVTQYKKEVLKETENAFAR
ncbi:MAG: hypothetical protein DRN17_04105, partial [Thermoplasmata archaeon]